MHRQIDTRYDRLCRILLYGDLDVRVTSREVIIYVSETMLRTWPFITFLKSIPNVVHIGLLSKVNEEPIQVLQ